jgi:hypothetical protein
LSDAVGDLLTQESRRAIGEVLARAPADPLAALKVEAEVGGIAALHIFGAGIAHPGQRAADTAAGVAELVDEAVQILHADPGVAGVEGLAAARTQVADLPSIAGVSVGAFRPEFARSLEAMGGGGAVVVGVAAEVRSVVVPVVRAVVCAVVCPVVCPVICPVICPVVVAAATTSVVAAAAEHDPGENGDGT